MSDDFQPRGIAVQSLDKGDVPAPGAPLRDVVIHPDNIAAMQRQQRANKLPFFERIQLKRRRKQLRRIIHRLPEDEYAVYERMESMRTRMGQLHTQMREYKQMIAQRPHDKRIKHEALVWQRQHKAEIIAWRKLQRDLSEIMPIARELANINNRLAEHEDAVIYERHMAEDEKELKAEAIVYEQLIISKLTLLGFRHKYSRKGREYVDKVQFAQVGLALDAIWFEFDTSYQTAGTNWQTNLPEGVTIWDMTQEKILHELSHAVGHPVFAVKNENKTRTWLVVSRLNSTDGMMNYLPYRDVLERYPAKLHNRMPMGVGVAKHRELQWITLEDIPHMLVAGFTGSGKSNLINACIASLITKQQPEELRLLLIDLKGGLEFSFYEDLPHLAMDIVTSVTDVSEQLAVVEAMMYSRFDKMRGKAKTIMQWNSKYPDNKMPRILCVFDEVASIQGHKQRTDEIVGYLQAITRMGRAVGIHIWLCTQRPDVKAIPGAVKINLAARFSGRMPTSSDSVTILGTGDAKDLPSIPGRMVMRTSADAMIIQTPHITDADIADALAIAQSMPEANNLEQVETLAQQQRNEWTVEKIIEFSIKHMNGNMAANPIYLRIRDEGVTRKQVYDLVERIWEMENIVYEGDAYHIETGKGKIKTLVKTD